MECIALHRSITLEQIIEYLQTQKVKNENAILADIRKIKRDPNAQFSDFTTEFERKRYQENDVTKENIMNALDRYTLIEFFAG